MAEILLPTLTKQNDIQTKVTDVQTKVNAVQTKVNTINSGFDPLSYTAFNNSGSITANPGVEYEIAVIASNFGGYLDMAMIYLNSTASQNLVYRIYIDGVLAFNYNANMFSPFGTGFATQKHFYPTLKVFGAGSELSINADDALMNGSLITSIKSAVYPYPVKFTNSVRVTANVGSYNTDVRYTIRGGIK